MLSSGVISLVHTLYFQSNVEVRVCGENRKNDIADNAYLRYNKVANN
jgi:hypothetical protein